MLNIAINQLVIREAPSSVSSYENKKYPSLNALFSSSIPSKGQKSPTSVYLDMNQEVKLPGLSNVMRHNKMPKNDKISSLKDIKQEVEVPGN